MFSPQQINQFKKICSSFGITISEGMIKKFQEYASLLLDWNKRIHLVSKKDAKSDRILRHFVDSLSIFKVIDLQKGTNILDLGAGAGIPAIPIKIVREDTQLTLIESIHKKTLFLQKLSQVLEFKKLAVINQRIENLVDQTDFEGKFDLVTAKALGKLKNIVLLSMPFLKTGGLLVAYKGQSLRKEIEEIGSLKDCRIRDVVKIEILEMDLLRNLVVIEGVG
jgi:16S rRNA (guanine527-N7)-methyltransferase